MPHLPKRRVGRSQLEAQTASANCEQTKSPHYSTSDQIEKAPMSIFVLQKRVVWHYLSLSPRAEAKWVGCPAPPGHCFTARASKRKVQVGSPRQCHMGTKKAITLLGALRKVLDKLIANRLTEFSTRTGCLPANQFVNLWEKHDKRAAVPLE